MSEYEEGYIHFTIIEFARLCEDLGFHYILPLLMKQLHIYRALPDNIDDCLTVMNEMNKMTVPMSYVYKTIVNEMLEEAQDDVLVTDEEAPDGK